jgi:hypothetical protein
MSFGNQNNAQQEAKEFRRLMEENSRKMEEKLRLTEENTKKMEEKLRQMKD